MNTFQVYVKNCSNTSGLSLTTFANLSQEWKGEGLVIPFGEEREVLRVVGWTDLFGGLPCQLTVVKAVYLQDSLLDDILGKCEPSEGYLIYGGNCGLRVLSEKAQPIEGIDDHLPRGYGMPIMWIDELTDLPPHVQRVVSQEIGNQGERGNDETE